MPIFRVHFAMKMHHKFKGVGGGKKVEMKKE
jgi:hypothetical protein